MHRVVVSRQAAEFFEEADASLQRRLDRAFEALKSNRRRHNNIKPSRGQLTGQWRYRVGVYRVIYHIDDAEQVVNVTAIVHRGRAHE